MRASGATAMAEASAVPSLSRVLLMGSAAFKWYIQKNPVVLHALILL